MDQGKESGQVWLAAVGAYAKCDGPKDSIILT